MSRIEAATISAPTALISGVRPRRMVDQMYIGKVLSRPVRKKVTGISSKLSVKDRMPAPITAVRMFGSVTRKKVCQPFAPRSAEASSRLRGKRCSRA